MPSSRNSFRSANISHDPVTIPGAEVGHDLSYKYGKCSSGDLELWGRAKRAPLKHRERDVIVLHSFDNFQWHRGLDTSFLLECRANAQTWVWGDLFRNVLLLPWNFIFFLNSGGDCFWRFRGLNSAFEWLLWSLGSNLLSAGTIKLFKRLWRMRAMCLFCVLMALAPASKTYWKSSIIFEHDFWQVTSLHLISQLLVDSEFS